MTFHNTEYLFLLLLLIPVVFWYFWKMRKSDASMQISSLQQLGKFPKSKRIRLMYLPFVLRTLAAVFLIIALARPQLSNSWRSENVEGIDIMMALDISGTMLAEDLKPNRLEAAKNVATEFILSRPDDNIGLTLFARESFTQCPLTTDHAVLVNLFNGVQFGLITDGTAIGLGLGAAVNRIKEGASKSKVIILLTDGSNNSGDISPLMAAELAQTFGIRVYTIGVGSHGKVRMPYNTPIGVLYDMVDSDFDEKTLQQIAGMTGGEYFRATNNTALRSIYQEIDKLEKTKINVREFTNKREMFLGFALAAFVLLLLEILIRTVYLKRLP
jgi:Ca-activated chloride channel family protein